MRLLWEAACEETENELQEPDNSVAGFLLRSVSCAPRLNNGFGECRSR